MLEEDNEKGSKSEERIVPNKDCKGYACEISKSFESAFTEEWEHHSAASILFVTFFVFVAIQ